MTLLNKQEYVSPYRGMPVETLDDSTRVETVTTDATIQFYYNNAGTPTVDAGQAVGTVVVGAFAQKNILNFLGTRPANEHDTSLAFTSTAATTEIGLPTPYDKWDTLSFADRLAAAGTWLANGQYFVDYVHGEIYIKKASTQTALATTSYKVPVRGGSSTFTLGSVAVTSVIPGTGATNLGKAVGGAAGATDTGVVGLSIRDDALTALTDPDGDYVPERVDGYGSKWVNLSTRLAGENQTEDVLGVAQKLTTTSSYAYSVDVSTALEASSIIKASAGNLYKFTGRIDKTAATDEYWIHVVDSATVPADGAVTPIYSKKYNHTNGTDTDIDADFGTGSIHGDNGLVIYASTTEFTKAITGAILSLCNYYK
jgi:hypothetical protein